MESTPKNLTFVISIGDLTAKVVFDDIRQDPATVMEAVIGVLKVEERCFLNENDSSVTTIDIDRFREGRAVQSFGPKSSAPSTSSPSPVRTHPMPNDPSPQGRHLPEEEDDSDDSSEEQAPAADRSLDTPSISTKSTIDDPKDFGTRSDESEKDIIIWDKPRGKKFVSSTLTKAPVTTQSGAVVKGTRYSPVKLEVNAKGEKCCGRLKSRKGPKLYCTDPIAHKGMCKSHYSTWHREHPYG